MATFDLVNYPVERGSYGSVSIKMHLGTEKDIIPRERVELKTLDECKAALADYAAKIPAGVKAQCCIVHRTGRKPSGFAKWREAWGTQINVNLDDEKSA